MENDVLDIAFKKAVESKLDFSDLLENHPLAKEVMQFITEHIN